VAICKGKVIIFTGNGKGKTCAAIGQSVRAIGNGLNVYIIQFMKGSASSGEIKALENFPNCKIERFGNKNFVNLASPSLKDITEAKLASYKSLEIAISGKYDLIVLDEICTACKYNLLSVSDIIDILKNRKPETHIILTGRSASRKLFEYADIVTNFREIKYIIDNKHKSVVGIEL